MVMNKDKRRVEKRSIYCFVLFVQLVELVLLVVFVQLVLFVLFVNDPTGFC